MERREQVNGALGINNVNFLLSEIDNGKIKEDEVKMMALNMKNGVHGVFMEMRGMKRDLKSTMLYMLDKWWTRFLYSKDVDGVEHLIRILKSAGLDHLAHEVKTLNNSEKKNLTDHAPPYIVLLGEVGCGKSKIVEKITGETGRSSDDTESKTRCSEVFWSHNDQLIIADTPGSNSSRDQFGQNMWIASAFNFMPVSKIFIVVRADGGRIDGVISGIKKISDRFIDLPFDPLGVIVTHMDKVTWKEEDIAEMITVACGIRDIVFSSLDTSGEALIDNILKCCKEKFNLNVDHDNFLKIFRNLHKNTPRKVLQFCSRELVKFKKKHDDFTKLREKYDRKQQVDLVFEFQAFMKQEIIEVQKRMQLENSFTFDGDKKYDEAAHIQNLTNQLISVLHKIRIEAHSSQLDHQGSFRKCPHCGVVWTTVIGCDGETRCGSRADCANDLRYPGYTEMATFTFQWNSAEHTLAVSQGKLKSHNSVDSGIDDGNAGCGRFITWSEMQIVEPPEEFSSTVKNVRKSHVQTARMSDVDPAHRFNDSLDDILDSFKNKMVLTPRS
jgi:hypothetical protein